MCFSPLYQRGALDQSIDSMTKDLESHLDAQALSALSSEKVIRCLYKVRCRAAFRRCKGVFPWSIDLSEKFGAAISRSTSADLVASGIQLLMVVIYRRRPKAVLCFDYYTDGYEPTTRENITNRLRLPVHQVHERHGTIYISRSQRLDKHVVAQLTQTSSYDRGLLPFYRDEENIPVYGDGHRIEHDEFLEQQERAHEQPPSDEEDDTSLDMALEDEDVESTDTRESKLL